MNIVLSIIRSIFSPGYGAAPIVPAAPAALLAEDGSFLLAEDGTKILLEV